MDYITIEKMKIFGHTGCLREEKINGQFFYVTLRMGIDNIIGCSTDNLEDTIDYSKVYGLVSEIVYSSDNNLIEFLAQKIIDQVLNFDKRIAEVKVIISKPDAPINGTFKTVKTEITRKRFHKVYLSLGSNMGDKKRNLEQAILSFKNNPHFEDIIVSSIYETEPVGYEEQDWFYNICLKLYTDLTPYELLNYTQGIEKAMYRVKTIVDGPRIIDVDILTYEDVEISGALLTIPHPRMFERLFVMRPLLEIAEDGEFDFSIENIEEDKAVKKISDDE